jgi:hypothetical protein
VGFELARAGLPVPRCFWWDRLQPVLLRSRGAMSGESQDRKNLRRDEGAQASLVAPAFLPVPHVARCVASQNKEPKNAFFDLACLARAALRSYVGTGRNACATERQNADGVIVFSYDATVWNDAATNEAFADISCARDDGGSPFSAFCRAGGGTGGTAAESESAAAGDCASILYRAWRGAWCWAISGRQHVAAFLSWCERDA